MSRHRTSLTTLTTRLWAIAAALVPAATATPAAAQPRPLAALRPALEERIARHEGTVGVAVIDLATGDTLSIRGDEPFPTASIIKVPVLVEVFHQVEHGRLHLDDPIVLLDVDKRPGSGLLQYLTAPLQITVRDAALLMIALSDNTATNLLVDKIGIRSVGVRMDSLGLPRTELHSKVFDRASSIAPDSSARWGLGVTTPNEMARLLAMIYRGEAVSPEASKEMMRMLRAQFYGEGIPRYLPPGTRVAHKTGSINESRHDCGIVSSREPQRDYVLCVLTKENRDTSWRIDNEAHVLIADLARIVHEGLTGTATQ
ncbi:MAG TPA: serine hydrolase [Longimicrobiales bacterium]